MGIHRKHLYPAAILLLPLALALCPGHARGQLRPGIERGDYWGAIRARYRSEVLEGVGQTLDLWVEAWNGDDVDGLVALYAEGGALLFRAGAHMGPEGIRSALMGILGDAGPIQIGLQDFDVSGDLAFATTTYRYPGQAGRPEGTPASGYLVWIMRKEDGSWRIRSQVFQEAGG